MITGHKRGHKYYYDEDGSTYYIEDGLPLSVEKPCSRCGKMPTHEGHDACLGTLPNVKHACCGHGVKDDHPYIIFDDGRLIEGEKDFKKALVELI